MERFLSFEVRVVTSQLMKDGSRGCSSSIDALIQVLDDGSVVKVNRTTVYDKEEDGKGFSFVHSVRKTKKGASEEAIKDNDMEEDENVEENVEGGEEENEIFSKRK